MGIHNIHILKEPGSTHSARKLRDYTEAKRIVEHRTGQHPYGRKRRDCPLCQSGN